MRTENLIFSDKSYLIEEKSVCLGEKQANFMEGLSDDAIKIWLVRQVRERIFLTPKEIDAINSYILSRLILIKDVAESCRVSEL